MYCNNLKLIYKRDLDLRILPSDYVNLRLECYLEYSKVHNFLFDVSCCNLETFKEILKLSPPKTKLLPTALY